MRIARWNRHAYISRGIGSSFLALAMGTALLVSGAAHAEATPASSPRVGAVVDITWGLDRPSIVRTVQALRAAGIGWVRASINWAAAEPVASGVMDQTWLADTDYAISQANAAGLKVLMPIADGVPYWASADPAKYQDASGTHWNKLWHPTQNSDYGVFAGAVARRYSAQGVHTYEVWNEPNNPRFWPSGPDVGGYAQLLAAAYPAIKKADPRGLVLLGGLSKNDYVYLQGLYAAGAANYFDAVAIHPYTGSVDPTWCWNQAGTTRQAIDAFCGIVAVHQTMVANGDAIKSIWLTEFGWSTSTGSYGVSEATQAFFLTEAFNQIKTYPYVRAAFWYNGRDTSADRTNYDDNLGLLRSDFSPKPSYNSLQSWITTHGASVTTTP